MNYLFVILIFVAGESVGYFIFLSVRRKLGRDERSKNKRPVLKGILERLMLYVGLLHGFPQILIAFAALKLGTRFREDEENRISNDYFLIGNLISILLAMIYSIVALSLAS